jgi:hypothetical protein
MVSTRFKNAGPSNRYAMTLSFRGCVKDGQPVLDSNFSAASKRTRVAAQAGIDSRLKEAAHFRAEGALRSGLPRDVVFLVTQLLAPFGIRLDYLVIGRTGCEIIPMIECVVSLHKEVWMTV